MPKTNSIKMCHPGQSGMIVMKALKAMHETPQCVVPSIEPEVRSTFDLSTEELGFFMHNGKKVDIIFPR